MEQSNPPGSNEGPVSTEEQIEQPTPREDNEELVTAEEHLEQPILGERNEEPAVAEGQAEQPISLEDNRRPVPTPSPGRREPEVITDILIWSELTKYLTAYSPSQRIIRGIPEDITVDIQLDCIICSRRLSLPSWISTENAEEPRLLHREPVCPLPCGHFFGRGCLKQWQIAARKKGRIPACPICRFKLIHPDPECQHNLYLRCLFDGLPENDWIVPFSRTYQLDSLDWKSFIDISEYDVIRPSLENNYHVGMKCLHCRGSHSHTPFHIHERSNLLIGNW